MENRYDIPQSSYSYYRAECFTGKEHIFKTIKCHNSKVNQIVLNFLPNNIQNFHLEKITGFVLVDKDNVKHQNPDEKFYKNSGKYMVPLEYYFNDVIVID